MDTRHSANPEKTLDLLTGFLSHASIEVTAREPGIGDALQPLFASGTDVHVTFLQDDASEKAAETCVGLRAAGFNPIPHLTARNFVDLGMLERHLARMAEGARVVRALVIAGDVDRSRGPFASSIDLIKTGLLEKHGIRSILVAGHPEGHPAVSDVVLDAALKDKIAAAQDHGLKPEIVTQFCFEAGPVVAWLARLRGQGIHVPVRIGVAGPANTTTLVKFAMRCGVGNSLRVLKSRASAIGKLMSDTKPDELLNPLAGALSGRGLGPFSGIHLYMFGGARKTSAWLADARNDVAAQNARQRVGAGI